MISRWPYYGTYEMAKQHQAKNGWSHSYNEIWNHSERHIKYNVDAKGCAWNLIREDDEKNRRPRKIAIVFVDMLKIEL